MTLTTIPFTAQQYFDNDGNPAAGYQLFFYVAGTSTKLAVYTDSAAVVAASNPIVLDAAGRPPSNIFMQARTYKIVLATPDDSDPPASPLWSMDDIAATPPFNVDLDVTGTSGEAFSANDLLYLSAGDGSRTAGRWYKADSDLDYASVTARIMGFAVTQAAAAAESCTVRRMGRVTGLSGLTAGLLYYASATAGGITSSAPSNTRRVGMADSTASLLVAAEIVEPLKGYIPIDLFSARVMSGASIFQNTAGLGGLLCSDTAPSIQRVNAATDRAARVRWAATIVTELALPMISYPPDLDDGSPVEVHFMAAMAGATDSPTMAVTYFEGIGDTNAGGNSAAITGTTITEYTVTIAATDIGAHPNFANISFTPAAHGTDELRLYAAWIEYTRKLKST